MTNYWMGEPIDDMPRERLIQIIDEMGRDLAGYSTPEMCRAIGIGKSYMRIKERQKDRQGRGDKSEPT